MSQWLENIRQSDNRVKFRYVLLFTGIVGTVVVAVWATAVRNIIESRATAAETVEQPDDSSFFGKIGSIWNGIVDRTKNTIHFFENKASETNEITIEKTNTQ